MSATELSTHIIVPITNSIEVESIKEASSCPHFEVNEHFNNALKMLADRNNPDYRNSIKESIIAVERMCSIIIGKSTTLGDALKTIRKKWSSNKCSNESCF